MGFASVVMLLKPPWSCWERERDSDYQGGDTGECSWAGTKCCPVDALDDVDVVVYDGQAQAEVWIVVDIWVS